MTFESVSRIVIGRWVKRARRPDAKWHLVESVIEDAAITRCGRRMEPASRKEGLLEVSVVEPLTRAIGQPQNCKRCSR
jgi:hypothetical protein